MSNRFNETITDDELRQLPLFHFEGQVSLVDTMEKFREAMHELREPSLLGFDTETRPSFRKGKRYNVSLLQLADGERAWLFRLNVIGLPEALTALLADPSVIKTGVAITDDIKALQALTWFEPDGFIDLQDIVASHGIRELGLKKLSAITLGHSISKSQQISNWEADELTDRQQLYAATDAWVCRCIYLVLNGYNVCGNRQGANRGGDEKRDIHSPGRGNHGAGRDNHIAEKGNRREKRDNHIAEKGNRREKRGNHSAARGNHSATGGNHSKERGNPGEKRGNHNQKRGDGGR